MPRVKHRQERLQIIDELLFTHKHIENWEDLLKRVNLRLIPDRAVSVSSIDKDVNKLKEEVASVGIELRSNPYHYSDPKYRRFKQRLTAEDKTMLIIAQNLFKMFKDTALKSIFKDQVAKVIANGVPSKCWEDINEFQFIRLENSVAAPYAHHLPNLIRYIYDKKAIRVKYGLENGTKHLSPYVLKQYKGKWYFVAYDHSKTCEDVAKIYSLARVHQKTESDKANHQEPNFDAQEYFKYSIGIWHRNGVMPVKEQLEFKDPWVIEAVSEVALYPTKKVVSNDGKKLGVEIEVYESPQLESLITGHNKSAKAISRRSQHHIKKAMRKFQE